MKRICSMSLWMYNSFMFNSLNAKAAGSKGGKASTTAKRKAARANGALGGHPSSRTLAERLLNRPIHPEQQKYIDMALSDLFASERLVLEEYFRLDRGLLEEYFLHLGGKAMNSLVWRTKSRRIPKHIRYLIKKFKLAANYYLRDVAMPKSYTVEYQQRDLGYQRDWDRRHSKSRIPCPPQKVRIDVRSLPEFARFERFHKEGVDWTVEEILDGGGGLWTKKRALVAIEWLNATYPRGHS